MMRYLRQLRPLIVDGQLDEERRDGDLMQLRYFVTALEQHTLALTLGAHAPDLQRTKLPAKRIVPQIWASLDLRSRSHLRQVAAKCLQASLPDTFEEVCRGWAGQLTASPSSLQRGPLLLDLAMARMHAKRVAGMGAPWRWPRSRSWRGRGKPPRGRPGPRPRAAMSTA